MSQRDGRLVATSRRSTGPESWLLLFNADGSDHARVRHRRHDDLRFVRLILVQGHGCFGFRFLSIVVRFLKAKKSNRSPIVRWVPVRARLTVSCSCFLCLRNGVVLNIFLSAIFPPWHGADGIQCFRIASKTWRLAGG